MESADEKRLKNECIDRIGQLPDETLGQILSHLSLREAAATSVLSTRWRNLFPSAIPFSWIQLYDSSDKLPHPNATNKTPFPSFINFVDNFLNKLIHGGDGRCVEKVVLNLDKDYGAAKVLSWFSSVLKLNVQHLQLKMILYDSEPLFRTINGCTTLVDLHLGNGFELYLPKNKFILPNLKKLSLWELELFHNKYSIQGLLDGCPVLEDLQFYWCDLSALRVLYVRSLLLKKLTIDDCNHEAGCKVVIDASNLEFFQYEGYDIAKFVVKNSKPSLALCIDFHLMDEVFDGRNLSNYKRRVANFLRAFSGINRLYLSARSMTLLHRSSVKLPTFSDLTCVALDKVGIEGWIVLARLLPNAPKLEVLLLEKGFNKMGSYENLSFTRFKSSLPSVPVCVKLHLKKIELWKFRGHQDEVKFIEYLLENGQVLEEVVIHCLPWYEMNIFDRLNKLPKFSEGCQILLKKRFDWLEAPYSRFKWEEE